jgi:amidase
MAGPDARDPLSQRAGSDDLAPPFLPVTGRRVAWSPTVGGLPIDPAVRDTLAAALPLLAEAGLDVSEDEPDFSGADEVFETWRAFGSATGLGDEYDARGGAMKATVRAEVERGRSLTSSMLSRATRLQAELAERLGAFFDRYDYLACPVTQVEPFPIELEYVAEIDGRAMGSYIEWMRSNSRISVTCCPAISVPVGFSRAGLPVGLQLVTRPFGERALLEVAHELEQRTGLGERMPPLAG